VRSAPAHGRWNSVGPPTFGTPPMDDKTLNLCRQIDGYRRRAGKRGVRGKGGVKAAINDN